MRRKLFVASGTEVYWHTKINPAGELGYISGFLVRPLWFWQKYALMSNKHGMMMAPKRKDLYD